MIVTAVTISKRRPIALGDSAGGGTSADAAVGAAV